MTPRPLSPNEVKPLPNSIRHRFVKTRLGWYVSTTHGIGRFERGMFAWTRAGAERKTTRLTAKLRAKEQTERFEVVA